MTPTQHPVDTVSTLSSHTETETRDREETETNTTYGEGRLRGEPILPSMSRNVTRDSQAPSLAANLQGLVKMNVLTLSTIIEPFSIIATTYTSKGIFP